MTIYPAIDIIGGKCVRLEQGDFKKVTVYSDNPCEIAKKWQDMGAKYIHVVDLDGAHKGEKKNIKSIKNILESVNIPVQVGGGIRRIEDIKSLLDIGVNRVIIGTKAVYDSSFLKTVLDKFGEEKIVVGIDAKNGMAATHGWETVSDISAIELGLTAKKCGAKTIIYTDISTDGMLMGPNYSAMKEMVEQTNLNIIASGGISSVDDIVKLKPTLVSGVIVGKALYIGKVNIKEAIERTNLL